MALGKKHNPMFYSVAGVDKFLPVELGLGLTDFRMLEVNVGDKTMMAPMMIGDTYPVIDPTNQALVDYKAYWLTKGIGELMIDGVIDSYINPKPLYGQFAFPGYNCLTTNPEYMVGPHGALSSVDDVINDINTKIARGLAGITRPLEIAEVANALPIADWEIIIADAVFGVGNWTDALVYHKPEPGTGGAGPGTSISRMAMASSVYGEALMSMGTRLVRGPSPHPEIAAFDLGLTYDSFGPYNSVCKYTIPGSQPRGLTDNPTVAPLAWPLRGHNLNRFQPTEPGYWEMASGEFEPMLLAGGISPEDEMGTRIASSNPSNLTWMPNYYQPNITGNSVVGYLMMGGSIVDLAVAFNTGVETTKSILSRNIKYVSIQAESLAITTSTHEIAQVIAAVSPSDADTQAKAVEIREGVDRIVSYNVEPGTAVPDNFFDTTRYAQLLTESGVDLATAKVGESPFTWREAINRVKSNPTQGTFVYVEHDGFDVAESPFEMTPVSFGVYVVYIENGVVKVREQGAALPLTIEAARYVVTQNWFILEGLVGLDDMYDQLFETGDLTTEVVSDWLQNLKSGNARDRTELFPSAFLVNGIPTTEGLDLDSVYRMKMSYKGLQGRDLEKIFSTILFVSSEPYKLSRLAGV